MEERAVPEGKYSVTVYTAIRDQRCVSNRVLDHIPGSVKLTSNISVGTTDTWTPFRY